MKFLVQKDRTNGTWHVINSESGLSYGAALSRELAVAERDRLTERYRKNLGERAKEQSLLTRGVRRED